MSKHKHNYSQHYNNNKPKQAVPEVKMVDDVPEATDVILAMGHNDPVGEPGIMGVPGIVQETSQVVRASLVNETVETKPIPDTVTGMVVGCSKLNVRAEADLFSNIVCVLDNRSEIAIDVNKSNRDWFYICTATGVEGYCMRKFVEAHL